MNRRLRVAIAISLIPLGIVIGYFIPIWDGSAAAIGGIVGIVLCCLLIDYKKSGLPTTYHLTSANQQNGGVNQQAIHNATLQAQESAMMSHHIPSGDGRGPFAG